MSRYLPMILLLFVIIWIASAPSQAAAFAVSIGHALGDLARGFGDFLAGIA